MVLLTAGISYGVRLWRIYHGDIIANIPDPDRYPVCGVDVSRYQGNIDWQVIASQDITFAFIKATEGSSHQDPNFYVNWQGARESGIYVGAYHFFSFESEGATQAQNFIDTVGELDGTLPPVVDIEFYGDYAENPLSVSETRKILDDLLDTLEAYYGVKPIIYTTTKAYYRYISGGGYGDYLLWIRNTYKKPFMRWTFWQYSDEGKLDGYDGLQADHTEMYIDLNVYNGSREAFLKQFGFAE
jgi:lysozyme